MLPFSMKTKAMPTPPNPTNIDAGATRESPRVSVFEVFPRLRILVVWEVEGVTHMRCVDFEDFGSVVRDYQRTTEGHQALDRD